MDLLPGILRLLDDDAGHKRIAAAVVLGELRIRDATVLAALGEDALPEIRARMADAPPNVRAALGQLEKDKTLERHVPEARALCVPLLETLAGKKNKLGKAAKNKLALLSA